MVVFGEVTEPLGDATLLVVVHHLLWVSFEGL